MKNLQIDFMDGLFFTDLIVVSIDPLQLFINYFLDFLVPQFIKISLSDPEQDFKLFAVQIFFWCDNMVVQYQVDVEQ